MYHDTCSWWCYRCGVVIKNPEALILCQMFWVNVGGAEEVECDVGFLDNGIPQPQWEVYLFSAQSTYEVTLPCLDGSFGKVSSVLIGRDQL